MSYFYCEKCHGVIKSDIVENFIDCEFCPAKGNKMGKCDLTILKLKGIASTTYYLYCYECELLCHPSKKEHTEPMLCPKVSFTKAHHTYPIDLVTLESRLKNCTDSNTIDIQAQLQILRGTQ